MYFHEANNVFYDWETPNISFLQVAQDLKTLGIKNNANAIININKIGIISFLLIPIMMKAILFGRDILGFSTSLALLDLRVFITK